MFESPAGSGQTQDMSNPQSTPKARGQHDIPTSPPTDRKTTPQNPTYPLTNEFADNESEVDGDVQARQLRPRERIVFLREKVLRMRQLRRQRRGEVSRLREDVRDTLDKLTRKINELVALGKLPDNLEPLYDKLCAAQGKLGPAEDEYDKLERRLDWEEEDLGQQEDHFYRHNDVHSVPASESKPEAIVSPLLKSSQTPEMQVQSPNLENDLVQDYFIKVEEANGLNDELDEMENNYYRVTEDASFRKRQNIPLHEETATFLKDYPKLRSELLASLHDVEQSIFELRDVCLKQGLFADSENVYVPYDALSQDITDLLDDIRDRSPLCVAARRFKYPTHAKNFQKKREYVNIWLLSWVQESPVDMLMLKNMVYLKYPDTSGKDKELDNDGWTELVLENWDTDSMGAMASEYYIASWRDAIAGDANRPTDTSSRQVGHSGISSGLRSLEVDLDNDRMVEELIMGSETGSYSTQKPEPEFEPSPENLSIPPLAPQLQTSHSWPISPKRTQSRTAGTKGFDTASHDPRSELQFSDPFLVGYDSTFADQPKRRRSLT